MGVWPFWPTHGQFRAQKAGFTLYFTRFWAKFESTAIYRVFLASQKPCNIEGKNHLLCPKSASVRQNWPKKQSCLRVEETTLKYSNGRTPHEHLILGVT